MKVVLLIDKDAPNEAVAVIEDKGTKGWLASYGKNGEEAIAKLKIVVEDRIKELEAIDYDRVVLRSV